jgi:hypothetical protein
MADIQAVKTDYRLQQWAQIVHTCRASGLTNKVWCQQNGIAIKTYYYWLHKLRISVTAKTEATIQCSPAVPKLVEVSLAESRPQTSAGTIRLRYRDAEIEIPAHDVKGALCDILEALNGIC